MLPSPVEKKWGTGLPAVSGIVHFLTGGTLGWLPGAICFWLWKDRSRFVAFNSLQCMYLGALSSIGLFLCGILIWTHIFAIFGYIFSGIFMLGSFALYVIGAISASRGEVFQFPVVGARAKRITGV